LRPATQKRYEIEGFYDGFSVQTSCYPFDDAIFSEPNFEVSFVIKKNGTNIPPSPEDYIYVDYDVIVLMEHFQNSQIDIICIISTDLSLGSTKKTINTIGPDYVV
jgi:hypothetical protein